jgi:hypothetical protein
MKLLSSAAKLCQEWRGGRSKYSIISYGSCMQYIGPIWLESSVKFERLTFAVNRFPSGLPLNGNREKLFSFKGFLFIYFFLGIIRARALVVTFP